MSHARNALMAKNDHLKTLKFAIGCLMLMIIGCCFFINKLAEERKVYVPPDLSNGYLTRFEVVPKPVIYSFTYYIFQQLHRWKKDGLSDYPSNLYRLQAFLTPTCLSALRADMNDKKRLGELRQRTRFVQEIDGKGYNATRIDVITQSQWRVSLYLNLRETINRHLVKNIDVRYDLPVVKFDVDREANPWGLAIACDESTHPILLNNPSTK